MAFTTVDLALTFVRPITPNDGPVRCEGIVVHADGTISTAEARLTSGHDGRLLAHGTTTCLILPAPAAQEQAIDNHRPSQ